MTNRSQSALTKFLRLILFSALGLFIFNSALIAQDTSPPDPEPATGLDDVTVSKLKQMAEAMLNLIDHGKYEDAYALLSDNARGIEPLDHWTKSLQFNRASKGDVVSRSFFSGMMIPPQMKEDKATYLLHYETTFKEAKTFEEIQFQQDAAGTWHIIAYCVIVLNVPR